jgi:hypothetical protein
VADAQGKTGLDGFQVHHTRPENDGPTSNHIHQTHFDYDHHYEGPYNHRHSVSQGRRGDAEGASAGELFRHA